MNKGDMVLSRFNSDRKFRRLGLVLLFFIFTPALPEIENNLSILYDKTGVKNRRELERL